MINHRGPEFAALITDIVTGLRDVMRTRHDVLLFPASGTGGLEATVVNLLSPGERALFCTMGAFGERWADIAAAFGVDVVRLSAPAGEAIDPDDVDRVLTENSGIKSVFVTHNETSTGVTNDLPSIAGVVKRRGLLLAVDSVSGAGCLPLDADALGIDVVVTGSQKGWMAPPGLTMIATSPAALEAARSARLPRWYFDFAREKKFQDQQQTYTTPPLQVMYALQEGLAMIRAEGVEQVWARHARIGAMIRGGLGAMGLRLFAADGWRSDTVTAVHNPFDDAEQLKTFLTALRTRHRLVLAGGQSQLKGKIFRIGHLGAIEESDAYAILALLEQGLMEAGRLSRSGLAVAAAQVAAGGAAAPTPVG